MVKTKEELLEMLKKYDTPPPETVTLKEYYVLQKLVQQFRCPLDQNPFTCNGKICPHKPKNVHEDYYWECREARNFRVKLMKIMQEKTKIETSRKP